MGVRRSLTGEFQNSWHALAGVFATGQRTIEVAEIEGTVNVVFKRNLFVCIHI